ncbi:MAG: TM2 domain-containing protein [Clostridia bacterium]|nr:TM2 domain-containing protein [Clostridia bacterium]
MKSKWIALTYCLFWGYLGAHKFYEKKYLLGITYLFTMGLFGFGVIHDALAILSRTNYK